MKRSVISKILMLWIMLMLLVPAIGIGAIQSPTSISKANGILPDLEDILEEGYPRILSECWDQCKSWCFKSCGCGNGNFCPNNYVPRKHMAAFLYRAFELN